MWAFESLVWCTFVWGGFLAVEFSLWGLRRKPRPVQLFLRLLLAFGPFLVVGALAVGAVDAFYFARLGHGPDWTGYLEFSALYATDSRYHVLTEPFGPGWLIVVLLAALATPAIYALSKKRYDELPILAACWLATWACAAYYVGEPYDNHVSALTVVLGFAYAVASLVMDRLGLRGLNLSRLAFVPMFVLLITTAYGEPARIATIVAPFLPGYQFDAADRLPTISGELAQLIKKAGITPKDRVILPNSPAWVKLDDGLIAPFIRGADGHNQELIGWLPESPAGPTNTLYSLPLERRWVYLHRFLQIAPQAGWYITYHSSAICAHVAPGATNVGPMYHTINYSATRCTVSLDREPSIVRKVVSRK